jgi:hypothetical protein
MTVPTTHWGALWHSMLLAHNAIESFEAHRDALDAVHVPALSSPWSPRDRAAHGDPSAVLVHVLTLQTCEGDAVCDSTLAEYPALVEDTSLVFSVLRSEVKRAQHLGFRALLESWMSRGNAVKFVVLFETYAKHLSHITLSERERWKQDDGTTFFQDLDRRQRASDARILQCLRVMADLVEPRQLFLNLGVSCRVRANEVWPVLLRSRGRWMLDVMLDAIVESKDAEALRHALPRLPTKLLMYASWKIFGTRSWGDALTTSFVVALRALCASEFQARGLQAPWKTRTSSSSNRPCCACEERDVPHIHSSGLVVLCGPCLHSLRDELGKTVIEDLFHEQT